MKDGTTTTHISTYQLGHHLYMAHRHYKENERLMREAGMESLAQEFNSLAQEAQEWGGILQYEDIIKVVTEEKSLWVTHHDPAYGD